ncbi:MAG: exo-alpha-sialidase, partial [Cytophagia bacterium]|nr:exo-alpha-sialidase [Cytophagia bacterium]
DGFESVPDPVEPNIVYAQSQNGGLGRFDLKSGESVTIIPRPRKGEKEYNFNWDSPILVSPHDHKTLYYAANKVFKSTDRGDSWEVISDELDQDIDRNLLPIMGKVWPMDAVAKNGSTSRYGAVVALDESRLKAGLIYAGSDDGQISVTDDGGQNWFKINSFPGVPANTYVYDLIASKHDENTVYAAFNNHKSGDFKPYVYVSNDKGRTWKSISNNLPEGAVYALEQDHVNANILFAGTEYGVHVSLDAGASWKPLKSGLPTINVRDMAIQERENDLVLATFGRGFYVLDDYSAMRELTPDLSEKTAHIFAITEAKMFNTWTPLGSLGSREHGFQGEMHYSAPNPQTGAIIKYYLKDGVGSLRADRQKREAEAFKNGEAIPYPTLEEYKAEQNEPASYLVFTIKDQTGDIVSELRSPVRKGMGQVVWDMTYMNFSSVNARQASPSASLSSSRIFVVPGTYTVTMSQVIKGELTELVSNVSFEVSDLDNQILPADDWAAMAEFKKKAAALTSAMNTTRGVLAEMSTKITNYKAAAKALPIQESLSLLAEIEALEKDVEAVNIAMNGDSDVGRLDMDQEYSMRQRAQNAAFDVFGSLSNVTGTSLKNYDIAANEFAPVLESVKALQPKFESMDQKLGNMGAPLLPGALPDWKK